MPTLFSFSYILYYNFANILIQLKKPIKTNNVQGPIALATKDHISGSKRGIVSGWGKTRVSGSVSEILRWLTVNVLSQERCLSGHKNPRTNENQICTLEKVGKGACQVSISYFILCIIHAHPENILHITYLFSIKIINLRLNMAIYNVIISWHIHIFYCLLS